jgi:hypothetical protein
MKTSCALFLIIAGTILLGGTGYAAQQVDSAKHRRDTKSSDRQTGHHGDSGKNSAHRPAVLPKANRPQPRTDNPDHSANGKGVTVNKEASNKTNSAAIASRRESRPASAGRIVHPPTSSGPFGQIPNSARHRGANSAIVGGTAKSVVRNTGAVSGTGVSHKR